MKTKNVNQQKTISIQLLLFLLIVITFYPTAEANAQRISSSCTSNNSLEVKVNGIHNVSGSINIPMGNNVKSIIAECTCRAFRGPTCPSSIIFTVNGINVSAGRIVVTPYSSWEGNGESEGDFYVYRLVQNIKVTSLKYNAPASANDRLGMKGLTTWIVNNDAANANQPNTAIIDQFHFRVPARCFNIPIKPTNAVRNMTIYFPVSEIDDPTRYNTRYSATALNASGNVVASLPAKTFNGGNVAPEIRLDQMLFKNVPSNATTIRVCIESPHPDTGFKGPSFMIGSVAVTSKQAKPTLTCPPGGIVACASDIQPGIANYTPSCPDDNRTVVVTGPVVSDLSICPGTTYTYTHSVGGLSCKQVFTIGNSDAPSIACNPNIQYVCEEDIDPAFPDYTASCGTSAIEKSEPVVVGEPGCAGTSYTYFFSVTDACGRSTSCEQIFVIKEDCTTEVETNYCDFVANEAPLKDCIYTLKKDSIAIYDCNTCTDYKNPENCKPVTGLENLSANEAFWAAIKTAEYFKKIHKVEMPPINIFVNCSENPIYAVYKIKHNAILLGKGDDIERTSMAALDIIAHEMTHHLIKSIGSLSNYGENGALNESFADIFGEMVENYVKGDNDWIFGSDVFLDNSAYNGIRNFADPDNSNIEVPQPYWYGERYWEETDLNCDANSEDCSAHINSGIQNLWFYLLVNGYSDGKEDENFDGIGIAKASEIAFANMASLDADDTYVKAMIKSISMYESEPVIAETIKKAWKAVGVDFDREGRRYNPIDIKLIDYRINGVQSYVNEDGVTVKPRNFDLALDSLGLNFTANNFTFTILVPENYRDFKIETIYPALQEYDVNILYEINSVTIKINSKYPNMNKKSIVEGGITSGEPLLGIGACIDVIDVGGEESKERPIVIYGNTTYASGIVKEVDTQIIGIKEILKTSPNNKKSNNKEDYNLALISYLSHQNCLALGSIEVEIVEMLEKITPLFNYYLYDGNNILLQSALAKADTKHQFFNLQTGIYKVKVEDNSNKIIDYDFEIEFIADLRDGICCPNKLKLPQGVVEEGKFFATDFILIDENTEIKEGLLKICGDKN